MLAILQGLADADINQPKEEVYLPSPAVNAATNIDVQLEILQILQEIYNANASRG